MEPRPSNIDELDELNELNRQDKQFARAMIRAGIDWEPPPPRRGRIARGTDSPDLAARDARDEQITQELPVVTRQLTPRLAEPLSIADAMFDDPMFDADYDDDSGGTVMVRPARSRARWLAVMVLLVGGGALVLWSLLDKARPAVDPVEVTPVVGATPQFVELPPIIVELDSPMSLPDGEEPDPAPADGDLVRANTPQ